MPTDKRRRRRLRAKPEVLAARKAAIDAAELDRIRQGFDLMDDGRGDPDPPHGERARDAVRPEQLELRTAERDRALELLGQLERALTTIGGYSTPAEQAAIRESRALLVELGRREPEARV